MSTPLDSPTSTTPGVYLAEPGSYVDVGIVDVNEVPSRDYDTGDQLTWDDGTPRTHKRITGIVVGHQGAATGSQREHTSTEPNDVVAIHADGHRAYAYRDALRTYGQTVNVGDVLRWKFDHTEPAKNPRHNDRRVHTALIRAARAEDGDLVARCEAERLKRRTPVAADEPERNANGSTPDYDDEEPF